MNRARLLAAGVAAAALVAVPLAASASTPHNTPGSGNQVASPQANQGLTLRVTSAGNLITQSGLDTEFKLVQPTGGIFELVAENSGNHTGLCIYSDQAAGLIYDLKTCDASKIADQVHFAGGSGYTEWYTQWDFVSGYFGATDNGVGQPVSIGFQISGGGSVQSWKWRAG